MNNTADKTVGCLKEATRILGDKWTPQLLRFFANEQSLRFCQIEKLVTGINPRTLSARLASLEHEGIINRTPSSDTSRCEYSLTDKGRELIPILHSMNSWSEHYS